MIASLPMYDRASTRAANDRLWQSIREALGYGPEALTRSEDLWALWHAPELLFAQTCSLPYRMGLHRAVEIVATPVHDLDCAPGRYFSVIVAREAGVTGGRIAVNSYDSHSGWAEVPSDIATRKRVVTGSHAASVRAVAEGRADLAAIDAVTWGMLERDGETAGVQVVRVTPPTPALPFITARGNDVAALREALASAVDGVSGADMTALKLYGIVEIPEAEYRALPIPAEVR